MRWRSTALPFAVLLLCALVARLVYVRETLVIVDEFEHLHGAYLVARGERPYVDFFEHHPPLFYYLAAPLIPAAPTFDTIIHARYLSLGAHALAIAIAGLWMRAVFGRAEALLVTCLLVGNFFLFARGTLSYLDTYALPLVLLGAWALTGSRGRPRRAFLSGLSLGLALLITQKAVLALLPPLAFFLCPGPNQRTPGASGRRPGAALAAWGLGGLAAALVLPLLLGPSGTAGFVRNALVLNLHWQARHLPTREIAVLAATDGLVYAVALLGLAMRLRRLAARRFALEDGDVPAIFLAALALGAVLLPVVWEEYFILLVPFAVILAGLTLLEWWRRYAPALQGVAARLGARASLATAALACVPLGDLLVRRLAPINPLSWRAFATTLALWLGLGSLAVLARTRRRPAAGPLWIALLLAFPLVEQLDWTHHNSNAGQRARVAYVLATTSSTDRVFDGYSGFGVFRPHAYPYWFLHEEMRAMLSEDDLGTNLVRALEAEPPAIAIVDQHVRALPPVVRAYLAAHYADTRFPDVKRRRDDGAALAARPP